MQPHLNCSLWHGQRLGDGGLRQVAAIAQLEQSPLTGVKVTHCTLNLRPTNHGLETIILVGPKVVDIGYGLGTLATTRPRGFVTDYLR